MKYNSTNHKKRQKALNTTSMIPPSERPDDSLTVQGLCAAAGLAFTALISIYAWQSEASTLALLTLPLAMNLQQWRWWPTAVAATYFGVGNRDIPAMVGLFFDQPSPAMGWLAFAGLTLIQTLPFLIYSPTAGQKARFWRMALALAVLTLPPIGLIAWRSPLYFAGVLFPGAGYIGVLLAILGLSLLAAGGISIKPHSRWTILPGAIFFAGMVGMLMEHSKNPPPQVLPGWHSIDTSFHPTDLAGDDEIRGQQVADLLAYSLNEGMQVIVLPESVFSPAKPVDQLLMTVPDYKAKQLGITILAGEIIPEGENGKRWRNVIRAYGATTGVIAESRAPMPVGNWRPGTGTGVTARPFATDLIELQTPSGTRTASVSICFEDAVLWPHFGLLTGRADVMVSVANVWALTNTSAEKSHDISANLLARLAGVPMIRAKNTEKESSND